jgi:competence protein ComEC
MKKRIVCFICVFVIISLGSLWFWHPQQQPYANELTVVMLNIGQGDAIYLRTPHGNDVLIDGGVDRSLLYELGKTMPPFDHQLELVIATHPDSDHIAGLMELTDNYTVAHIITNGRTKETAVAQQFGQWVVDNQIPTTVAQRGDRIEIEQDVWLDVLNPSSEIHEDANNDSLVAILHYGETAIAFTGDAPSTIEEELIATYGEDVLDVDVLKVGHHGSRFSTSNAWLQSTTPEIALISAGVNNSYHHPHPSVLYRLRAVGAEIFRTDLHSRVTCHADGHNIECAPQHN